MEKWSFTPDAYPERRLEEFTQANPSAFVGINHLLKAYMHSYFRSEYDENIPLCGTVKNETTGQVWTVSAKGSTFVEYEHQIDDLRITSEIPDPHDYAGEHPDQVQLEEVIEEKPGLTENREFHEALGLSEASKLKNEARKRWVKIGEKPGLVVLQDARTMFNEAGSPYTAKASRHVDHRVERPFTTTAEQMRVKAHLDRILSLIPVPAKHVIFIGIKGRVCAYNIFNEQSLSSLKEGEYKYVYKVVPDGNINRIIEVSADFEADK